MYFNFYGLVPFTSFVGASSYTFLKKTRDEWKLIFVVTNIIPQTLCWKSLFLPSKYMVEFFGPIFRHCAMQTWTCFDAKLGAQHGETFKMSTKKTNQLGMNINLCESHSFRLNESSSVQKMARGVLYLFFFCWLSDMDALPLLMCLPFRCCGMCVHDRHSHNLPKQVHGSLLRWSVHTPTLKVQNNVLRSISWVSMNYSFQSPKTSLCVCKREIRFNCFCLWTPWNLWHSDTESPLHFLFTCIV